MRLDSGWMLDIGPSHHEDGDTMTCAHCRTRLTGEVLQMDKGVRLSTGEVIPHDTRFCGATCLGEWMNKHYPWLCEVRERVVA